MTVDHDMQHQPDIRQMVIDKEKQKTYVGPFWWHIWANFGSHTFFFRGESLFFVNSG